MQLCGHMAGCLAHAGGCASANVLLVHLDVPRYAVAMLCIVAQNVLAVHVYKLEGRASAALLLACPAIASQPMAH